MNASLLLERIGFMSPRHEERRQWVAEIVGVNPWYDYERRFVRSRTDYSRTVSIARGTYKHYVLESGRIYEVYAPLSWKRHERYFCTVTAAGDIIRMTKSEIDAWIAGNAPRSE